MRVADPTPVEWHVEPGRGIPPEVASAAARGVPIVARVRRDAPLDGQVAELLDECASVIRYDPGRADQPASPRAKRPRSSVSRIVASS